MNPTFKKPAVPEQETPVWVCSRESDCNGWIREDFAFEKIPVCQLCGSDMIRTTKMLPVIHNELRNAKSDTTWRKRRGMI